MQQAKHFKNQAIKGCFTPSFKALQISTPDIQDWSVDS